MKLKVMRSLPFVLLGIAFGMPAAVASSHRIPAAMGEVVATEPGTLQFGQTVLVDDGSCPAGQIKQITGGSVGHGIPRKKECVAH